MLLYLTSFLGGVLTILAPCVLPVLPVILTGSLANSKRAVIRPFIITLSLAASIVLFTILLKWLTVFIAVPTSVWQMISGAIIALFGATLLFPNVWTNMAHKIGFEQASQNTLQSAGAKQSVLGEVLLGFSLGPIFASCSPTYSLLVAVVFPISVTQAVINIILYALGLSVMLFAIAVLGHKLVKKLGFIAKPNSTFKKVLGVLLVLIGIAIFFSLDKRIESNLLDSGYTGSTQFEENLIENLREDLQN